MVSKYFIGIFAGLFIAAAVFGGFFLGGKKSSQPISSTQPSQIPSPTKEQPIPLKEKSTTGFVNPSATIYAIETAFAKSEKNLGTDLEDYMTDPIQVVLYGSEASPTSTRKEAGIKLDSYFKNTSGWDFSMENPTAKKLIQTDAKMFGERIMGTTADGYAAAFKLNNEYLIEEIIIVPDYRPYLPN